MAVEGRAHLRRFRLFLASNGTAEPSALNQGKTANRAYTRKKKMEVDVPYPSIEQVEYIKRVEQIIKDTEQGIVTANYQTGHPHGYISAMYRGELAISKIQYANDENFYEFKKQAERYPTALKKGLTDRPYKEVRNMEYGYYNFDLKIVNKSTQSVVAMAAYRSDEALYSERDGLTKKYKEHSVKPVSFIMTPKNAPSWAKDREKLWNEVEKNEKAHNARLARNVLLSLPKELDHKQQEELVKEYVKEQFVDEGMVADVSIHRDEEHNPHAHILLTVRPFTKDGEWEKRKSKRVPILDEKGEVVRDENGWRKTRSVKLTNWDDRETLLKWRKVWAEKLNQKSKDNNLNLRYSHESYEKQGRKEKALIRLTRQEYHFEKRMEKEAKKQGKTYQPKTYWAKKNEEIKEYNKEIQKVSSIEDYKVEKDYKNILDRLRKENNLTPDQLKSTKNLINRAKGYIDYSISRNLYNEFHQENNKWLMKLNRKYYEIMSEKQVIKNAIESYKENPSSVEKYGFNAKTFVRDIEDRLLELKPKENKLIKEREKFFSIKEDTKIVFSLQKQLLDKEFSYVYPSRSEKEFSYEEKNFAISNLKENSILIPIDQLKDSYKKHMKNKKENISVHLPAWKQVNNIRVSIMILERSMKRMNKQNDKDVKHVIQTLALDKQIKHYKERMTEYEPLIDEQIKTYYPDSQLYDLSNLSIESKAKILEQREKTFEQESFSKAIEQAARQNIEVAKDSYELSKQIHDKDEIELTKDIGQQSQSIAGELVGLLRQLEQSNQKGQSEDERIRKKLKRKKKKKYINEQEL